MEHQVVTQRFVEVVKENRPNSDLVGEGTEGVKGLELGNAMQMSALLRKPVDLPLNGAEYDAFLEQMHKQYGGKKMLETKKVEAEMGNSFAKM